MRKADKLWNDWVSMQEFCAVCGESREYLLERHHLIGKGRHLTRCNPNNGILLCSEHHRGHECSPHGAPDKFNEWMKKYKKGLFEWVEENKYLSSMKKPDFEEDFYKLKHLLNNSVSQLT